jgi:hypothetical protein
MPQKGDLRRHRASSRDEEQYIILVQPVGTGEAGGNNPEADYERHRFLVIADGKN